MDARRLSNCTRRWLRAGRTGAVIHRLPSDGSNGGRGVRILVASDIHGNLEALQTVLAAAGAVDAVWCLGDTVGYGPEPDACVRAVRDRPHLAVPGNHDWAAVGKIGIEAFNPDAAKAARWTMG